MDMSIYDGLKMRHKRQIDTKDFIRTVKSNLFNNTFPSDIPFWSPKDGDHLIDFVPWIAGKDMPLDRKTGTVTTREGEIEYVIDVDVHCRIGPASLDFICPKLSVNTSVTKVPVVKKHGRSTKLRAVLSILCGYTIPLKMKLKVSNSGM